MGLFKKSKVTKYPLILFSIILLANPNVSIFDFLPDFIAYFILAHLFLDASDKSPFFAEARSAFIKLGWLTLLKPFSLIFVVWTRMNNTLGNDTLALVSFVLAVAEAILMIIAISNIFNAFFRLGERTDASALINPFNITKRRMMTTDSLKMLCYLFAIVKCAAYGLPDLSLLTTVVGVQVITVNPIYPVAMLIGILASLVVGIIWALATKKFAMAVTKEGKFNSALDSISSTIPSIKLESVKKTRALRNTLIVLTVAIILTLELRFDNLRGVNLFPPTLFAALTLIALYIGRNHIKYYKPAMLVTFIYAIISTAAYFVESSFLSKYGYESLLREGIFRPEFKSAATEAYDTVKLFGAICAVANIALIIIITLVLRHIIFDHTGISPKSQNYNKLEKEFHSALSKRTYAFTALSIISAVLKFVYIYSHGEIETVYTDTNDITRPTITAPSIEWISFASSIASLLFIAYALYYFSILKDEIKMKYSQE